MVNGQKSSALILAFDVSPGPSIPSDSPSAGSGAAIAMTLAA